MNHRISFLVLAIVSLVMGEVAQSKADTFVNPPLQGSYSSIVVFGDSLSDAGNAAAMYPGIDPGPTSPGPEFPYVGYYPDGIHYSNGPTWVEQLATHYGLPMTPSLSGGLDYAYGDAATGMGMSNSATPTPNLGTQMNDYLASHTPSSTNLYVIWGGANDIFQGQTNMAIPAENIASQIQTLYDNGARQFLVPNLPPLDETPWALMTGGTEAVAVGELSVWFNEELAGNLSALQATDPGIRISQFDTYDLFNDAITNPANYGLTNVTSMAMLDPANAGTYLFWDSVHPTAYGHELLAEQAVQGAVPEPSTLTLCSVGAIGLIAYVWRRRRAKA